VKRLCLFHEADHDGQASAAIVKRRYPDVELIGWDYGKEVPWDKIEEADEVIMVDISFQPYDLMKKVADLAKLTWIDHHATAIKNYEENKIPGSIILKDGIGACVLTWQYYFPDENVPAGVRLLGEYDVWNHLDPSCKAFEYGMRVRDTDPKSNIWEFIFSNISNLGMIVDEGDTILLYIENTYKHLAEKYVYEKEIDGLKFLVANNPHRTSDYFDSVWDIRKYDGMMSYFWTGDCWNVSLYTSKENIDVSKVAEKYGGGGHKKAAGFQVDDISFLIKKGSKKWAQHSQSQ